ncbi:MAG TPA: hypothetical protein PKI94_04970 [Candidatus Gastranaerophilaceae bacterium]|nr:hypothetical protein [Candidatus Gastranaerophilaceae bacterium]
MNKDIKHLAIVLALCFLRSLIPQACFAENYTGGFTQLKSAISSSTNARIFIANDNMVSTSALGAMSGTAGVNSVLTLNGANYNFNGAGFSGVTLVALRTLNVNNFGSLNPDGSVLNSIKNFNLVGNGAFIYNNGGTVAINNSVFSSNTATNGGVFYNNLGNSTITGSTFYNNSATSQGGAFFNAAGNFIIKNSTFTNNSSAKTISTTSTTAATSVLNYGGAIYNGIISSVTGAITSAVNSEYTIGSTGFSNTFNNNFTLSTNSGSTTNYDNTARGYGGAIYNSVALTSSVTGNNIGSRTSTTNINSNTFSANTNTAINSATTTNGTSYAQAYGGAVYNLATATTSGAGTGTNTATNTTNIKANNFSSNQVKSEKTGSLSVTKSPARTSNSNAYGGAIYNTTAASSSTTASINSNSTVATNIEQNSINNNNVTALNSSTANGYSATYSANTNAYGYGGAIFNSATTTASGKGNASNTTNIKDNTSINSNSVVATNNSNNTTLGTSNAYGYGGAIYNTTGVTNSGSGNAVNSTNISNNTTINNNSITATNSSNTTTGPSNAYGYGGAIYNITTATSSATSAITSASNSTNTTDILSNDISNNFILSTNSSNTTTGISSAYGYGGAVFNSLTATTNSTGTNSANNTANINNNNFNANYTTSENNGVTKTGDSYARAYGGTIYNTTASSASGTAGVNTSNVTTNIKNNTITNSSATGKNTGSITGLTAATRTNYAESAGGAIFNIATAAASSNGINTANNTTNIQNNSFDNNSAIATNTSTAVGYSTSYLANTNANAWGGSIYNSSTTTASGIGNATIILNITDNTSFGGNSATITNSSNPTKGSSSAYGYGGAIYNTTAASNSGTGTATNKTNISNNNLFSANSIAVTNSSAITTAGTSSAYGYGGVIYNTTTAGITGAGNTLNSTDISNNTFNDNFINSKNNGTAFGSNAYGYGGVIYNITTATASATSAITSLAGTENITNILSNNFRQNYINTTNSNTTTGASNAYGYGGAIYNSLTATANSTGINTALNTLNIESLFDTNSITVVNNGTTTNGNSYADAYSGAIYNITKATTSSTGTNTATVTTNIKNSTINNNSAVGKNLGTITGLNAVARNNYAEAFGGAIYNNSTATASSTGINVTSNTTNITGNDFNDNFALALNNSTATGYSTSYLTNTNTNGYGGAILSIAAATASGTQTATNKININENSFDGNYLSVTNSSNTTKGASSSYGYGGVIYSSLTSTASGSGITNTELSINDNSLFRNNSLNVTNSAITTTGSSNAYGYGGAIYATSSVLNSGSGSANHLTNINNNVFDTNTLSVINSGTTITGTSTARSYGGAVFVNTGLSTNLKNSASSTTNIKDNEFKNNSATATNSSTTTGTSNAYSYGGAIYTNTYTGNSGAVANSSVNTTNITGNTFEQNNAVATNSSTTIGTKTAADSYGGAIYNTMSSTNSSTGVNSSSNTVSILDNIFKKNSANNGGAIFNTLSSTNSSTGVNSSTNTLDIKDNRFEENTATYGGAIYNTWTSTGTNLSVNSVNITDNVFKLNTASYGGAIFNTAGTLTVNGNTFDTNSAKYGGAIANYISTTTGSGSATINVDNGTFEKNFAKNSSSTAAITSYGGAIFNYGYATTGTTNLNANVNNSTFDTNYAKAESTWASTSGYANALGGAIYNYKSSTTGAGNSILDVENTVFKNNYTNASSSSGYANAQGGAIYNASAGTQVAKVTIDGGTFNDNYVQATAKGNASSTYAYGYGGAIYNSGQLNVTDSSFNRNNANATGTTASTYAYGRGGAIYNTGTTTITNSTFTDNTAKSQGGAIYNTGTLKLVADNGTTSFTGNKANNISNALYLAGGTTYLNAGNGGVMTFNDKIASSAIGNVININQTSLGLVSGGEIIFNENVSDSTINLYSGMLTLGNTGNTRLTDSTGLNSSNFYTNNVKLNIYDAILNLANNNATDRINLNSFTSTSDSSLQFDADFATNQNDMFTVSSIINPSNVLNTGLINILNDGLISSLTLFSGGISPTLSAFSTFTTDYKYYFTPSTAGVYDVRRTTIAGLNYAIEDIAPTRSFSATRDTYVDYNLGTMGGAVSTLDIFGNDKNIVGLGYSGANTLAGQTLNITNVGSLKSDGTVNTSWNGFSSTSNGGGINNNGTVKITDSVFYNNTSTANGGLLYNANVATINTSAFVSNSAALGGAIYNSGTMTGLNDSFTSNYTTTANGGAVYNSSTVTLTSSTFKSNNALLGNGGAIFNSGTFNLTGATFGGSSLSDANSAKNGGAVYNTGNIFLSGSLFKNNSSSVNGGAINNTGTIQITNSIFENNTATSNGGAIYNSGTLKIIADGGTTSFTNNKASGASSAVYLASGSVMNVNSGNGGAVTFNDEITSESGASININKINVSTNLAGTTFAPTDGKITFNENVNNSTINFYNGTMFLNKENLLDGNNVNLYGGSIDLINKSTGTASFNNLSINGVTNLAIDADLANGLADKITSANPITGTGSLYVNHVNTMGNSSAKSVSLSIADENVKDYVTVSPGCVMGNILKYNLNYDKSTGSLMFLSGGSSGDYKAYNPAILTSSINIQTGSYLNQANVYNEALGRMDALMASSKYDRLLMKYQNKVASADGNFVFSPTFLQESSKGLWFKQYATFENVPMNNGPNVSNVSYGMLIGGDTDIVSLKHGFDGYLTAYVGYNGSHQNYYTTGVYQNGGLAGLTGTAYKGNFFTAVTLNLGGNNGNAYTTAGVDNFTTLVAGAAIKSGYNFEFLRGKLIVQPSLMAGYTFANTFDYTTASGVNMTSDPLHVLQLAPGIKFIGNLNNGWQPYIAANMVYNISTGGTFVANDVQLPGMSIAPYVEYGVGIQRKWGDRLTGFAQTMLRGGGRNGIALQWGLRWAF